MSQQELLKKVVQVLDETGIEYIVTGSVASSLQGEPRSTHDIDFVVSIDKSAATQLAKAFPPPDYYLDEAAIIEAIDSQGTFNLINVNTGDKVDFWLLTDEPFDRSRIKRKSAVVALGIRMWVSSPEDTILMKLKWANLSGGSEKQFTDALRVYEVQFEKLDMNYLDTWAKNLQVESLLDRLKEEAEVV